MQFDCFTLSMNQGKFLKEAIDSILEQETDFNYLVYDAGSTDGSQNFLKTYKPHRYSTYFVENDLGPADGLNFGLQNSMGDVFYYLNADDRLMPGALHYVSQYFEENPECDVLHGSINIIDESGVKVKALPAMKFSLKGYALGYSVVYQQATFIRNRVLQNVSFNVYNRISWDGELIVDLATRGARIENTRKVLGEFRIHSKSITGSKNYRVLAQKQHKKLANKILGYDPSPGQRIFALSIRVFKATFRRILPRISYIR